MAEGWTLPLMPLPLLSPQQRDEDFVALWTHQVPLCRCSLLLQVLLLSIHRIWALHRMRMMLIQTSALLFVVAEPLLLRVNVLRQVVHLWMVIVTCHCETATSFVIAVTDLALMPCLLPACLMLAFADAHSASR